jgi:hypothetical protein
MTTVRAPRRQADVRGARIKEGAASQPSKVSEAAPKLALLSFPRSSKGSTPAVTSEAIQVRILAGEPESVGPNAALTAPAPDQSHRDWAPKQMTAAANIARFGRDLKSPVRAQSQFTTDWARHEHSFSRPTS